MKIYTSPVDKSSIMRKLIILIEVITIVILLVMVFSGNKVEANKESTYYSMTATAYYPGVECCGIWADGKTYTGDKAGRGCIAIDPKAGILKLGQKVFVEEYGYGVCNDIGGAIKGWKVDLCFDTLQEAKEFGRKLVKVHVLN